MIDPSTKIAILLSWLLMASSSFLFFRLRANRDLNYGFGTELFAILFAVDVAVILGVVDPTAVLVGEQTRKTYMVLAMVLAVLTIAAATYAIEYEARAHAIRREYAERSSASDRLLLMRWLAAYLTSWLVRVTINTIHIVWIVRVPKWMIP
jgi:hypothetical protein